MGSMQQALLIGGIVPTFTVTAGEFNSGISIERGFSASFPYGSVSPTTLPDGKAIGSVTDSDDSIGSSDFIDFSLTGLGADPGQSYFTTLSSNGVTKTSASASSYTFGSGTARWRWNGAGVRLNYVNGGIYGVVIA